MSGVSGMSQFDVLEQSSLLLLGKVRSLFDQVFGDLLVEFGFEAGHLLKLAGHRRVVERPWGGEKGCELLPARIHRSLTGEEAGMVGH